jgi:hypothetical protein
MTRRITPTGLFVGIGVLLLLALGGWRWSEARKSPSIKTFGYRHAETTGITESVEIEPGRTVLIRFHKDSDPAAFRSLRALNWNVLYPNSDDTHLFIVGELLPAVQQTPDSPNRAQSEPYQEFRLRDWYLLTPFETWNEPRGWLPGDPFARRWRNTLKSSDFKWIKWRTPSELQRFQRKRSTTFLMRP